MKNLICICFLLFSVVAIAQKNYDNHVFYRVEIHLNDIDIHQLVNKGVELCHSYKTENNTLVTELSGLELNRLSDYSDDIDVIIEDMSTYYKERIAADLSTNDIRSMKSSSVSQFSLGSMGGQKTLEEVLADLDSMAAKYPDLITERFSIGQSYEDRDIWAVFMGTELNTGKPMVLYNALIHSREPNCMMAVVYYMWWLLENYGIDEEATFILDNRQLAFIPVLNPDGYEYNREIAPEGGGLQRKNLRPVGVDWQGVDLNRNFGPVEFWDHISGGSSTNPNSQVYRGEAPFSEPETQALKAFAETHDFRTTFNYHSYSNLLIYPYGVIESLPKDSTVFVNYGEDMTSENGYLTGTPQQTVGYKVRGGADDWFYGPEDGNPDGRTPVISFTPEVGSFSDGFWPTPSRIIPLCEENLLPNKLLARYAGPELHTDVDIVPTPDQLILSSVEDNFISFAFENVHNYGRTAFEGAVWRLSSVNESVDILINEIPFGELAPGDYVSGQTPEFLIKAENEDDSLKFVQFTLDLIVPGSFTTASWNYELPIQPLPTSLDNQQLQKGAFTLLPNAPNPFGESTTISFELAKPQDVTLIVMDIDGRKIKEYHQKPYPPGQHDIVLNGEHLQPGMYIYQMRIGHEVISRCMIKY